MYRHILYDEIDPATLGQCTGLKDKNGKLIFEGDLIKWISSDCEELIDSVKWIGSGLCLRNSNYTVNHYLGSEYAIIGNIHDNPELIEDGNE